MLETSIFKKKNLPGLICLLTVVETEAQGDLPEVTHEVYSTQVLCFLFDLSSHVIPLSAPCLCVEGPDSLYETHVD